MNIQEYGEWEREGKGRYVEKCVEMWKTWRKMWKSMWKVWD